MKLLLRSVLYYEMEVHPDRIDEIGDWQSVVDLDAELDNLTQVSDDYLEFVEIVNDSNI